MIFNINNYFKAIKNYSKFSGRSSFDEFWNFTVYNIAFFGMAILLDVFLNSILHYNYFIAPFTIFYCIFIALPKLSITIRRLHDVGKSGWFLLLTLIPIIGIIILIYFLLQPSKVLDK